QRREARRFAGAAGDQIRVGAQYADCEGAQATNSSQAADARRRGDRVKRRKFITLLGGAAAAWPVTARAQQPANTIGFFGASTRSAESQWIAAFVQRLRELGWIDGRNIVIEYRWAEGRDERFAEIAAEFVRLKVGVIVTWG